MPRPVAGELPHTVSSRGAYFTISADAPTLQQTTPSRFLLYAKTVNELHPH